MRARVRTLVVLAAVLLFLGISSAGATPRRDAANVAVIVVLHASECTVTPQAVDAGKVAFHVINRTTHKASFALARVAVFVGPKTAKLRSLLLVAGQDRYSCVVASRRIGTGLLVVRAPQPPEHLIGVREVGGVGELYDRANGVKFVPRGSNYIRLAPQQDASGNLQTYHSTFNVGRYDSAQAESALSRMAADGYNVVRVFLSEICVDSCAGDPATGSLRTAYMANVADFVRRAKSHGIFVLLTSEWLPPNSDYSNDLSSARYDWFNSINLLMLSPQGWSLNNTSGQTSSRLFSAKTRQPTTSSPMSCGTRRMCCQTSRPSRSQAGA